MLTSGIPTAVKKRPDRLTDRKFGRFTPGADLTCSMRKSVEERRTPFRFRCGWGVKVGKGEGWRQESSEMGGK